MDHLQFAKEWLNAWTGNQPQQLLLFYHPDAFYTDPAKRNGLKGHAQLLPYFEKLLAMNPAWKWDVIEIIPNPKGFTLKWQALIPAGTTTIQETGLDIVELKDGLITRNEVFFDRLNWMKALG